MPASGNSGLVNSVILALGSQVGELTVRGSVTDGGLTFMSVGHCGTNRAGLPWMRTVRVSPSQRGRGLASAELTKYEYGRG